jgi:phosphohistidine phosphatase SixA
VLTRRRALAAGLVWSAAPAWAANDAEVTALLRAGGVVLAFRHALAPGTYDPPDFKLGDCSTQRNLNDEGRAQARRIGEWLRARELQPDGVRASPWCRCMDTATLAFGTAVAWPALASPRATGERANAESMRALRSALRARSQRPGFEVWVTHNFVLADLTGASTASGEGLLLRADAAGAPALLARLTVG